MNQKPSPLHRASEWIVDHYRLFFVVFAALLVFSAVASGWVKVENDVAAYLPADSETRQGLDIMEQEFQTYGSAKILLRDTDADAAAATAEQIRAVDGVDSCTYTMNDTGSALLSVSLSDLEGSDTCAQTVQALRDLLDGSGAYIYSAEGYSISDQINGEVRGLLVIVAIILVTVLTFTSSTYAEVPILLITFLAAALINKGTNFVFGTISFVSNAVAILLQLAMSVDYAIIFCNRYKQAHETLPVREAVIESLEKSITVISSSSLTTIAGLVAMTFMKFGLGRDLGIVLIKAILISMLTVFLLMPGLLLKLGPAMDKTKHRNFVPKISGVGRLAWRTRRVVPLVFAAVLVVACIGANRVSYVYSEAPLKTHNADVNRTASQAITDDFGDETVLAVVVPAGDYTQEAALLDALSALPEVKSAVGIAGTEAAGGYRLADAVDYRTFAQLSGADSTSAPALFALYAAEIAAGQSKLDTAAGTLASGRQTLAANRQQLAQDLAALTPYEDDTERLEQGIAVLMQDETLRARAGASASYGDICALAQDLYTADMDTARTEAAVWTGICITLFAAGALAFAGVCLGHRSGKAVAWCTALAAILSVGCLIAMLAAGHGALRTLCLCAALALLVLAFVAAGFTLRQRAQRAQ